MTVSPRNVSNYKVTNVSDGVKTSWTKVDGAKGYILYAAYCGSDYKKITTLSADTSTYTITKLNGKAIDKTKCIRSYVVAYKIENGKKVTYKRSLTTHLPGKKNATYTGAKSITITSKTTVTLAVGKSSKIKAKTVKIDSSKKLLEAGHAAVYRYRSTAKYVATVDENGVITAKGKGICYIYVYAQNGVKAKVKVKVS